MLGEVRGAPRAVFRWTKVSIMYGGYVGAHTCAVEQARARSANQLISDETWADRTLSARHFVSVIAGGEGEGKRV